MPYTSDDIAHGTVRFVTLPVDQWHAMLMPWNGGGLMLRDPLTGTWRKHKIPFQPTVGAWNVVDFRDVSINGVPHLALQDVVAIGNAYNAYARVDPDNLDGPLLLDFSLTRETLDNGYIVKQGDPNQLCIGRVGVLPDNGGIGYPGEPTCAMCASFFQPEHMALETTVTGGSTTPGQWVELLPFNRRLHFVAFGDGREPQVNFVGLVANSTATYNTYVGVSKKGADPAWVDIGGGTSNPANVPVQAACGHRCAGTGDGAEVYQGFGLKMRIEGGAGSLPVGGRLRAQVWM